MIAEWWKSGRPTTLGTASGAVTGLVAITPPAGFVSPMSPMSIGLAAGIICFFAVKLKFKFRYDDSLDVVGIHLVGGIVGSVLLGVFAHSAINASVPDGLVLGGLGFFFKQVAAVGAVILFSFTASYILARVVKAITGLRVDDDQESNGLDISLHEERGYVMTE